MNFESFEFNPRIQATLKQQGFAAPTPIQAQAIPLLMKGEDLVGLAQTGTGKTAAFVLPILEKLSARRSHSVRALIIAPTRELAQQIHEVIQTFGRDLGLYSVTLYGGVSMGRQVRELEEGADLVVACPGRLLDHMQQRTIDLSRMEYLVLDEADQMFDMGFFPTIRRILERLPHKRQTMMFSATMPAQIRRLAEQALQQPVTIQVGQGSPAATVTHALFPVRSQLKSKLLFKLLAHTDTESVLVFVRTKHRAKGIARQLKEQGFSATSLQGNLSQGQRTTAMAGFRDGTYQIMVATDIAARGIDISTISHVINYDIPNTVEAYIHRIGRTGRAAKNGDAMTLVAPEDGPMVRSIERVMKRNLERRTLADFDYNAHAAQGDTPLCTNTSLRSAAHDQARSETRRKRPSSKRYRGRRGFKGNGRYQVGRASAGNEASPR